MSNRATPIGKIVGANVRRLRIEGGHTGDALARELREFGQWSTSRVSELELGRVSPTAGTLYAVAHGLSRLLDRTVLVSDLVRDDGYAEVGKLSIPATAVADALAGKPTTLTATVDEDDAPFDPDWYFANYRGPDVSPEDNKAMVTASGEAESKLARSLNLTDQELAGWSQKLWGKTFSARRDELAGRGANAQKRGQTSRKLKAELKAEIERVDRLFADSDRTQREASSGNH